MDKREYAAEKYDEFREYMVKRIDRRKYDLEFFTGLFCSVADYAQTHTMSVARVILMSGMDKKTFYQAKNGRYDDSLAMYLYKEGIEESDAEYVNGLPMHKGVILLPPSEIIDRIYTILEAKITEEMLDSKSMPQVTSRIFLKKAVFGYSDQPQVMNQTNVLNISDAQFDLAEKLLK